MARSKSPAPGVKTSSSRQHQITQYFAAFARIDTDESNSITEQELRTAMKAAGFRISEKALSQMVAEAGVDGDGTLDFDEFVAVMDRAATFRTGKRWNDAYSAFTGVFMEK